jgi:hypothetical protein
MFCFKQTYNDTSQDFVVFILIICHKRNIVVLNYTRGSRLESLKYLFIIAGHDLTRHVTIKRELRHYFLRTCF